jgi:hypothetical protein
MRKDYAARLTATDQWFRIWLPYTFVKLEAAEHDHVYLPLSRDYKPLGLKSKDWVDYHDFIEQAVVFAEDPHTLENVWHFSETLHLYGDDPKSRNDYFERFERLLSRSVKLFDQPT